MREGGPLALVVGDESGDPLVGALVRGLASGGFAPRQVLPQELALLPVGVDAGGVEVDGEPLHAALLRCTPRGDFAGGFSAADAGFVSAEVRALWLDICSRPAVATINRGDCEVWFAASEWAVWHWRLLEAGVPVAPLAVGDVPPRPRGERWLQWTGGLGRSPQRAAGRCLGAARIRTRGLRTALWCHGEIMAGARPLGADRLGAVLASHGVGLAGLAIDDADRVAAMGTTPPVSRQWAEAVAGRLVAALAPATLASSAVELARPGH